ncbi:MAG TPA: acyl-CoA dehydrogenase family protein [Vicinamibacterales bacterium]|nr:acyl-CoA dehydrogenase family protein [Vicinamibacterales bacterium]
MPLTAAPRGADWLVAESSPDILTPEKLDEEHRLVGQTAREFVDQEVTPALDELEKKNWALARKLLLRSGELGLVGTDVPESVGGVGLDKAASIVVGEAIGASPGFATAFGAQTGLAIIPILCFGTPAQQRKYLPRIVSGELVGAYCLSEAGSGSDALSARARAGRQDDGSWVLNGEKLWITNGGFADVFIVFAKVDGEHFSAFIVERAFPGVSTGQEEHKMGLHGSSTVPLLLQDARVPADNLLGEIGKGHKIAFNVLNYGRFKLAAMCSGGAKAAIKEAAGYAVTRRQFGQPIATFGAIRHKLAAMTIWTFAVESMLYRTAGLIDAAIGESGHEPAAIAAALEEYAIECSLLKVAGSEMLDYVIDEEVQIHGGNGFVRDYPAERRYRDARVNRIFEGTNEINRLLVPTMLLRRAVKSGLPLMQAARAVQDELVSVAPASAEGGDKGRSNLPGQNVIQSRSELERPEPLANERRTVVAMRKIALASLGLAATTYGEALAQEQEVLMLVSDIVMEMFAAESATLRAAHAVASAHSSANLQVDAAAVFTHDAALRVEVHARTLFAGMLSGDALRTSLAGLRRLLKVAPLNTIVPRRRIADAVTQRKGYVFE